MWFSLFFVCSVGAFPKDYKSLTCVCYIVYKMWLIYKSIQQKKQEYETHTPLIVLKYVTCAIKHYGNGCNIWMVSFKYVVDGNIWMISFLILRHQWN